MSARVDARAQEPSLFVQPRFFVRRRFLWSFLPAACVAVLGAASLVAAGQALVPFDGVTTLEGRMASKRDFFEDAKVRELLLTHGIRVHITVSGSREAVTADLDGYDFVFPSGLPTARFLLDERRRKGQYAHHFHPFASPIVLATYRPYAEALRGAGVATAEAGEAPLYYRLDMKKFAELVRGRKTWNDLDIERHGVRNGNAVLAQTPSVCNANSAATYLSIVTQAVYGRPPTTDDEAIEAAELIKPLLVEQGQPIPDLADAYLSQEGRGTAPVVVIYEHQYLAHQIRARERTGELDTTRVLLHPDAAVQTVPEFIALTRKADPLGELLDTDPELRRRAVELGFQVLDPNTGDQSLQLSEVLREKGVPVPAPDADDTATRLPDLPLLERMIDFIGDCPP